jgi:hypothetical protein
MTSSQISSPQTRGQTDSWQELLGRCTPLVLRAPKTWGDPLRSSAMERPQHLEGFVNYVVKNLVGQPWCDHLVLLAAVLYSQNIQYKTVTGNMSTLHACFTDLFSELSLQSMADWNVDQYLALYLSRQVLKTHTAAQRVAFWRVYQAGSRHLKRWLSGLPAEQQILYRPYVLPYPSDPPELTRLSNVRQVDYERQEKRKADTDALMPFYLDLRTQAHLRYNLLVRLRKAYYRAIKLVESGKACLPFEFELREGGSERLKQAPTERVLFKLWDRRTFVQHHQTAFSPATHRLVRDRCRSYADEKNSYLLEFVRAEPLDEAHPSAGLWFLELLKHDVLGETGRGKSRDDIREQQAWLRAHGYGDEEHELVSPFATDTPGVLLPPHKSGDTHFRKSAQARTDTLFIPVESFYVAALFGMVGLQILTANGMRIGELLQLRANSEGILPITLPPSPAAPNQMPEIHWAVRVVPKGHRTPKTYYLDDEHLRLLSLIKLMLCEHYHLDPKAGGDVPIVPVQGNNRHRFKPDRYLFQYNRKGLSEEDLRGCLRFLMHGLVFQTLEGRQVTIRPHLLRHGFATWALNVAKEPIDIVAAILNQKNIAVTKYYGRPNPRAIAERSHGLMHQISSAIDIDEVILRSPEELRELLQKAQQTHGTFARVRGGRCLLCGECPIFFACIGCSAKVPHPEQREEIEEMKQVTLIQIERARKKGLSLEVLQHQKKLKQCEAELREIDLLEACREDEQREPEVNFEINP